MLLEPGGTLWVDVELPRDDPRWCDDVGRAAWWLGELWADAVGGTVHRGPMRPGRWGRLVCFAGLAPGEVVDAAGAKVVGISQRRTRAGARFQCAVPLVWDPARLAGLLALDEADRDALVADLAGAVRPLRRAEADRALAALLARL